MVEFRRFSFFYILNQKLKYLNTKMVKDVTVSYKLTKLKNISVFELMYNILDIPT